MKHIFTLLFCIGFLQLAQAQKEGAIWYFGENAGLDFNSGAPVALNNGQHFILEGCATISTPAGDLLFYSDGLKAWNRNNQVMPNGDGLLGNSSSSQSAIIVPHPGDADKYYLFTVNANYHYLKEEGFNYSLVDMTLDGGNGDIVPSEKNIELLEFTEEKLTAVKKSDTEYWVVTRYYDRFYTYLVDTNGLNTTPIVTPITPSVAGAVDPYYGIGSSIGYMKFSPDGTKLAVAFMNMLYPYVNYTLGLGGLYLYDFDNNTGMLYNPTLLSDLHRAYGVEFSPDSSKLYVSTGFSQLLPADPSGKIFQFDMNSPDIPASKTEVLVLPYGYYMSSLQLAIDGKIYFNYFEEREEFVFKGDYSNYMSVLENPNEAPGSLNFNLDAISLNAGEGRLGLPTFIASYFNIGFTFDHTCLGDTTEFDINSSDVITSIAWDFGDGSTSTLENPTHTYAMPGDYLVSVTVNTATETKTETKEVTIFENPVANAMTDIEHCSILLQVETDLTTKDSEILGTQSALDYQVGYYASLADAQNYTQKLPDLYTNTLATETLYARIHTLGNTDCYDITSFELQIKAAPVLNPATDWTVCDTDTDGFHTFDLSQKDTEIYNGQDTGIFSIAYFATQADADANTNAINPLHTNKAPAEDIYFRIYNTAHPECYETGSFEIEVIAGVTANTPTNLTACDDDNDGIFAFDLSLTENEIIGTQNPASLEVTYHASLLEAENGDNALPMNYNNGVPYTETIYVRVANTADASCYNTTSFELQVYDTPRILPVGDWQLCDTGNNGVETFDLTEKNLEILGGQSDTDFEVSYYNSQADADGGGNAITTPFNNTTNPQHIFYRLENNAHTDCYVTASFTLELFAIPTAGIPGPLIVCNTDETGRQTVDLSTKDIEVLNGQDANNFDILYFGNLTDAHANENPLSKSSYTNSSAQETVYARIQNTGMESCYDISTFELIINPLPQPDLEATYVICPDSPELLIDGGNFESWIWHDENGTILGTSRTIDIMALGDYSLTVTHTQNGVSCEKTVAFEVVSSGAPEDFTTDIMGFSDTVTLNIKATGTGDFEYSVDGVVFQSDPRFEVFPGEHTVFVRDVFLCRTLSKEVIALGYQKFFTPNGDGNNEYWNVIGAEKYPESLLHIYDRYGKLIGQISPLGTGWDGTYKGIPLPASDYWFRYIYDGGKVFTGHFSLKR